MLLTHRKDFLESDIQILSEYKLLIDDQINSSDITFFNVSYEILKRISDVEGFYEAILNQAFDFNVDEDINLDYENLSYASNIDELRNLWRKRLKLSTLDAFASKKEINEDKIDQEENQLKSDEEIEKESRLSTKENLKDFFFNLIASWKELTGFLYLNSVVTQYDHTIYLAPEG